MPPAPTVLFTVCPPGQSTRSAAVIEHLREFEKSPMTLRVFKSEVELAQSNIPSSTSVALFDSHGRGCYALRNTRRYSRSGQPAWASSARYAACVYSDAAELIARQMYALFGKKFEEFVAQKVIRAAPLPPRKRSPNSRRARSRRREERMMYFCS